MLILTLIQWQQQELIQQITQCIDLMLIRFYTKYEIILTYI